MSYMKALKGNYFKGEAVRRVEVKSRKKRVKTGKAAS